MKFQHVDFNENHWKGKSKQEFLASESHHGLSEQQLEEAYFLINPNEEQEQASEVDAPDTNE